MYGQRVEVGPLGVLQRLAQRPRTGNELAALVGFTAAMQKSIVCTVCSRATRAWTLIARGAPWKRVFDALTARSRQAHTLLLELASHVHRATLCVEYMRLFAVRARPALHTRTRRLARLPISTRHTRSLYIQITLACTVSLRRHQGSCSPSGAATS